MSDLFESIAQGMREALEYANGDSIGDFVAHTSEQVDVQQIRTKFKMSQKEFSQVFGIELRTLQDWEQGRREPTGATKNYLFIIDREPEAVLRALHVPVHQSRSM